MGAKVRIATLSDAPVLAALTVELGYEADAAALRARLRRILRRRDHRVLVAVGAEGSVCGWLQASMGDSLEGGLRAEINGLVVGAAQRRRGVGRLLVSRAEAWARGKGAPAVVVRSNVKRVGSHRFYPSLGYRVAKTQVVYRKPLET